MMHMTNTGSFDGHEVDVELDLADAFEAVSSLYAASSPREAASIVAAALTLVVGAEQTAVYLYDVNDDVMRWVAGHTDSPPLEREVALGTDLLGRMLAGAIEQARTGEHAATSVGPGTETAQPSALLVRSVCVDGRLRVGIVLGHRQPGARFSAGDARVVDYVAERLADVLE